MVDLQTKLAEKMYQKYRIILDQEDCFDLAEDILSACADNADYTVPLKEWMNGKTFFHDYKVHDFPLVDLAYRLDPKNPNIPVSILILSLEKQEGSSYRGLPAIAEQWCVCDPALLKGQPCRFLQKARGFRDRCDKPYILPDYTPEQMYEIFSEECASEENKCICTDELSEQLKVLFRNWYHTKDADEDFSNARQVISLFEETKAKHYTRIGRDAYKAETVHELSVLDIPDEYSGIIETQSGNRTFEDVMVEINKYYGWSELKGWLENRYKLLNLKKNGVNLPVPMGHMCFIGGPGTGKSTSGSLFAEACYAMGLTSTSKFTKYLAKDLIAGFKGQTAQKIADAMEAGKKGVILIDEAYSLTPDPLSGNNDFETAAVDYLLDFTEVNQKDTIVILAGYEDKIKQLLASNRGLNDRFPTKITFPNFSPEECTQILNSMLEKYIKVSEKCVSIETQLFESVCTLPGFANARTVRNIQNEIFNSFSDRMTKLLDTADVKDGISQVQTLSESMILPEDIQNGFSNWHKSRK